MEEQEVKKSQDNSEEQGEVKDFNRYLSKEDIKMANKHVKRCSTLYVFREMQIKKTMRYHNTHIRLSKIQSSDNTKCW